MNKSIVVIATTINMILDPYLILFDPIPILVSSKFQA